MKIALVHDFFTQWGGGERVLKYFSEIWPEAPIYLIAQDEKLVAEFLPDKKVISSFLQKYPGMPKSFKYYLALMPRAIESFDFSDFDLILSDSSAYSKGAIIKKPGRHVCYLHTPTRYLTSDKEEYLKNAPIPLPLIGRPIVKQITNNLTRWDLQASRRPDYLIANSNYIAQRTLTYYQRTPDEVIFPPVDTDFFIPAQKIEDYWLLIARAEPYKRTDLAILAANKLGLKLKVVGGGTKLEELKKISGKTVEFLGRVSDHELVALYGKSIGFIFPPKEDAGMTPLEAMSTGRPVLAFGQGGALESIVPGVTGDFFHQQTVDSLVKAIKKFRPENFNPEVIRLHAKKFDKKIFKDKIFKIVENQFKLIQK